MAMPTETVERPRTQTTRATVWLAGAALAAAPLATAAYIASFGVNAVYADHVGNVVLFDAMSRGAFATLLLLDRAERAGPVLAGALAAATFASFSYLNGLLVWPIGALLLLFAEPRRPRYALLVIWLLVGAAVTATYFHGYTKPPQHPSLLFFARAPFSAIAYVLAAGGGALTATRDAAIAVGAVLCVLNGAAIAATIQSVRA